MGGAVFVRADGLGHQHLGHMITVPVGLDRSEPFTPQRLEFIHRQDSKLLCVVVVGVRATTDHPRVPVYYDLAAYDRVEVASW